ncbi:MAG: hypothetical protein ACP5NZ_02395 [Nanobdellota archaeon]
MKLNELLIQKPENAFIYSERKMNNEAFEANVSENYKTTWYEEGFDLPFILLDKDKLRYFKTSDEKRLINELIIKDKIRFFIHPEMLEEYRDKNIKQLLDISGTVKVSPTSSTRTVMALDRDYPFMIKTDLERKIGDGVKRLKKSHLQHIEKLGLEFKDILLDEFGYLAEPFGALFSDNDHEVGMVIREFYAKPEKDNEHYIIPFFSLFFREENSKDNPLLLQIMEKLNKDHSKRINSCFDRIIGPYLNTWANLVLKRGLSAEMHAQNTLLEVEKEGTPSRIIYRDLQDTFVDLDIRKNKNLNIDFNKNILGQNERKYKINGSLVTDREKCKQISYSLTYDYRMGRCLDYFAEVLSVNHPDALKNMNSFVKSIWNKHFAGTDIFPKKAYYLDKKQSDIGKELNFLETEPKYR